MPPGEGKKREGRFGGRKSSKKKMKPKAKQEHFIQLDNVTTLEKAAEMVCKHPNSVSYAVDAGHIAHKREGRIVLIFIPSLLEYYKYPCSSQ